MRPARDTRMTRSVSCVLRGIGRTKAAAAGWGWWVANVPDCHFFTVPHAGHPTPPCLFSIDSIVRLPQIAPLPRAALWEQSTPGRRLLLSHRIFSLWLAA